MLISYFDYSFSNKIWTTLERVDFVQEDLWNSFYYFCETPLVVICFRYTILPVINLLLGNRHLDGDEDKRNPADFAVMPWEWKASLWVPVGMKTDVAVFSLGLKQILRDSHWHEDTLYCNAAIVVCPAAKKKLSLTRLRCHEWAYQVWFSLT